VSARLLADTGDHPALVLEPPGDEGRLSAVPIPKAEPLPILIEGDARLRHPARPIESLGPEAIRDIARCFATLAAFRREHGFGRALAAPQVGIPLRLIAIDLGAGPFAVINPSIHWRSNETFELWDDCFSVPEKIVRVRRHRSISLDCRDEQFRIRRWDRLPPDLAELLQHEIDHLDGILMTDRAVSASAVRPASERAELIDAARPQRRLSLARIRDAARRIDPVFLNSPQFLSETLSSELGCSLTLKVETANPVGSFKGRGADFFVGRLSETRPLMCASAGNFGLGLAYSCRKRGIPLTVYASRVASPLKLERMRALSAEVRVDGADFDAAKEAARAAAAASGARMIEDGAVAEITEGAGSIAVELLARGDAFDAVVVPLGNGALLNGIARWVKAASPSTRVIGVCSRGAPAMAESFHNGPGGRIVSHERVDTIAAGIAVRVPIPEALEDMHGLVDDVILVDDRALIEGVILARRHAGLLIEPSAAAGLAAVLESSNRFAGQTVATVLTGCNITEEELLVG
jgi:peptide deformylase